MIFTALRISRVFANLPRVFAEKRKAWVKKVSQYPGTAITTYFQYLIGDQISYVSQEYTCPMPTFST
jgi:hypothetical protein